jgi:hypothetical protein
VQWDLRCRLSIDPQSNAAKFGSGVECENGHREIWYTFEIEYALPTALMALTVTLSKADLVFMS